MKNRIKTLVLALAAALAMPYAADTLAAGKTTAKQSQKPVASAGKTSKATKATATKATATKAAITKASKTSSKSKIATKSSVKKTSVKPAARSRAKVQKVAVRHPSAARTLYQDVKTAKYAPIHAEDLASGDPQLKSNAFMVQDLDTGKVLLERNAEAVVPIASITKLMTAMVTLDAKPSLTDELTITDDDTDKLKNTSSRLSVGTTLSREMMLHLALMSSENRAAATLARNYPGGVPAFVTAMNQKAHALGLTDTVFHDSTGLNPNNVSSARDLAKLVTAASKYPLIREFSTDTEQTVVIHDREQTFRNTNALVKSSDWQIGVSKTGFINEAGRCLVMQAWLGNKPMVIVLLDSVGKFTRVADAQRVKRWVEAALAQHAAHLPAG